MLTVRFPNGQAVQYNTANYVTRSERYSDLYVRKDGAWIAQIPNTCIIEAVPACRVYDAVRKIEDEKVAEITREIRSVKRKLAKK